MNEKGLVVLEQYELDVRNARRGRGSFLVDTDRGLKLLTEYSGTEGRLEFQAEVMGELREKGLERLKVGVRRVCLCNVCQRLGPAKHRPLTSIEDG